MKQFRSIHDFDKSDLIFKDPPFLATPREGGENQDFVGKVLSGEELKGGGKVTFKKGKVFQCYYSPYYEEETEDNEEESENDEEENAFKFGAKSHFPKNISETFDFKIGDKFYLRPPNDSEPLSEIVKIEEGDEANDEDILIWEVWERDEKYGYTQYLSNNVYLQNTEEHREYALKPNLVETKSDGSRRYKMNGGWLFIKNEDISEYMPSFEYTLEPDESDIYFYFQIEAEITKSDTETFRNANRQRISDTKVLDASDQKEELLQGQTVVYNGKKFKLIKSENKISEAEIVLNRPFIGLECAQNKDQKDKKAVEDHLGNTYDFQGKEFKRVYPLDNYESDQKKGRLWYDLSGHAGGNVELILFKGDAASLIKGGFIDGFKPTNARTNAEITHVCYTANPVPQDRCPPPKEIIVFRDYLTAVVDLDKEPPDKVIGADGEVLELVPSLIQFESVFDVVKYRGNGTYEYKCQKIPPNRVVILNANDEINQVAGDECEFQLAGHGDSEFEDTTSRFRARTSELLFVDVSDSKF